MRLIGHNWDKFVALSAIVFVAVMCAAILTIYNDPYEQAINPVYQKQETAGPMVDQAVGEAVEKYLKVLNAEWLDKDCTLSHCATSSKAIPGVPDARSAFTKQERANLVGRDSERACFAPIIGFAIYSVAAHNNNPGGHAAWAGISGVGIGTSKTADSTVSTIVYGTIIERNSVGEAVRSVRIPQRITLIKAATSGDHGPYVVMEDERLRASEENLPTSSFDPLVFRKFAEYPNDATRTDACVG